MTNTTPTDTPLLDEQPEWIFNPDTNVWTRTSDGKQYSDVDYYYLLKGRRKGVDKNGEEVMY